MFNKLLKLAFTICILTTFNPGFAQTNKSRAIITNGVAAANFIFSPRQVMPIGFMTRELIPGEYTVKVSPGLLTVNLPYFGRAYSVDYGSTEGGYNFTSKDYTTEMRPLKKGRYEMIIKPRDVHNVNYLSFNIFPGGYASLQVSSNNRQTISYNGEIKETEPAK